MGDESGERLAALERNVRRTQLVAVAAVAIALASFLPWPGRREIRARAFCVIDGHGEVVARLGENAERAPILTIRSPRNGGEVRVGSLGEDVAGLSISAGGDDLVRLSTARNGVPQLSLADKDARVILGSDGEGSIAFLMRDARGRLGATTSVLGLRDASGRNVTLGTSPDATFPAPTPRKDR